MNEPAGSRAESMAELGNQNKVSEMLLSAEWREQIMRFRDWGGLSSLLLGSREVLETH